MTKVYSYFDRPESKDSELSFEGEESLTQQQFKDDADINTIIKKYISTGGYVDPFILNDKTPVYGDVSEVGDLYVTMNIIKDAESQFLALPSEIRERFNNDPMQLLEFVADEKNIDEATKLGLVEALPVTTLDVTGTSDTNLKKE